MDMDKIITTRIEDEYKGTQIIFYSSIAINFFLLTNIKEILKVHNLSWIKYLIGLKIILFTIAILGTGIQIIIYFFNYKEKLPTPIDASIDHFFDETVKIANKNKEITSEDINFYRKLKENTQEKFNNISAEENLIYEINKISSSNKPTIKLATISYTLALIILFIFYFSVLFTA